MNDLQNSHDANDKASQGQPTYIGAPSFTTAKRKQDYSALESAADAVIYVLAFLFCRSFPFVTFPLGCVFVCALTLVAIAVFGQKAKASSPAKATYVFLFIAVALGSSPIFTSNALLILLSYLLFFVFVLFFVFYMHKKGVGAPRAEYMAFDSLDAFVALPLFCTGGVGLLRAMLYPIKKGKFKLIGKQLGYILIGLLLTLVPTFFVFSNLSYDSAFTQMLSGMFRFEGLFDILEYVFSAIFAIPIASYFYSALWHYQGDENSSEQIEQSKASHDSVKASMKILPAISVLTAVIPLMFLYVVFFVSQLENYTSAFSGALPDGFIYSEYARSGFFELCKVAGANAVFIFTAHVFTKNTSKAVRIMQRTVTVLLSLCSLCLIATAISKMLLYIDAYGLTQKRVYVSLFMILMAIGFILTVIAQLTRRIKMTWVCIALSVLMLIIPAYSNIDGMIASYNVDRYINGTLSSLDYASLDPVASMPALEKLYNSGKADKKDAVHITTAAQIMHNKLEGALVLRFNIPNFNAYRSAERILEKQG